MKNELDEILMLKKRRYARKIVTSALKKGHMIKPQYCTLCECDTNHIEAHHVDYGRPLAVVWLCKKCHVLAHTKTHKLNPDNNYQTPSAFLHECKDLIQVTVLLPIQNFRVILETAKKKKVSVSKLLKARIIDDYPVKSKQLDLFNFEEKNDQAQNDKQPRVPSVEANQERVQQLELTSLPQVWRERNQNVPIVAGEFPFVLKRYGPDAPRL